MRYIDKVICGESEFMQFMSKFRPGSKVAWRETIGHCDDVTIEMFYARSEEDAIADKMFRCYYWLYIPTDKEIGFCCISERRHKIYEDIRLGKIR